ncbi:glycosyltransferase family 2 protein [Treponema pedis]|uniref:glycosyltransferase family 2 protein n=1 Tax=Treponema pedis TaxID=409322 RepID=UPI003D24D211
MNKNSLNLSYSNFVRQNMPFITIIVLTYNPDWIKLKETLYSIIIQKGVDFDIIISDDGSQNDFFEGAKLFLEKQSFERVRFLKNERNVGTVKNLLSAFKKMKMGKFVKTISPGDFFYDEYSLLKIAKYINDNEADIYFGNSLYYSCIDENCFIYDNLRAPKNLEPYIYRNIQKIKRNYLIYQDYILGLSFVIKTDRLYCYLAKLEDSVIYAEDAAVIYMIADNSTILYIDDNLFWYEYGSGISTCNKNIWNERLYNDNKNVFFLMAKNNIIPFSIFNLHYNKLWCIRFVLKCYYKFFYVLKSKLGIEYPISITVSNADYSKLKDIRNKALLY